MTKTKLLAAVALTAMLAAPAVAKDRLHRTHVVHHRAAAAAGPVDAAAGVVGGAIGTAGAIATAPFRAFASDTTTLPPRVNDINPPKCVPGTTIKLEDGLMHRCQ